MPILGLGVSFRRAPIDLLERLAFTDDDFAKGYLLAADAGARDVVILSTCNRVEIYGDVPNYHAGFLALKRVLIDPHGVAAGELADPLYSAWERDAAEHLFAVASGLDSMVLGETQILTQVREALRRAHAEGVGSSALTGLFHAAARAGRRVRQETSLGAAPDAFVARAADLADEALGGLADRRVVVVGAGSMAGLAVRHLRRRGVGLVRVLNRSLEHARALAARTGSEHGELVELPEALGSADLLVSATGAAGLVVHGPEIAAAAAGRAGRPLVLIDLAVPRDVDPAVHSIGGVRVFDIDAIRERVSLGDAGADEEVARGHEIVADEVRRWEVRRRGDELAPLIRDLRRHGDDVVRAELDRWASRLADLTGAEREAVEAVARGVAAKLLHDPIVGLKERSEPGSDRAHARLLAELLGLELPPEA